MNALGGARFCEVCGRAFVAGAICRHGEDYRAPAVRPATTDDLQNLNVLSLGQQMARSAAARPELWRRH